MNMPQLPTCSETDLPHKEAGVESGKIVRRCQDGIELLHGAETTRMCGLVLEWAAEQTVNREKHYQLISRYTTPDYIRDTENERYIYCHGAKTGRAYLVIGKPVQSSTNTHASAAQVDIQNQDLDNVAASKVCQDNATMKCLPNLPSSLAMHQEPRRRRNTMASDIKALQIELEQIFAARNAGFDPDLKIRHVHAITRHSSATIYRKMKEETFPLPVKRGRSSFWKCSAIEAYMAGK